MSSSTWILKCHPNDGATRYWHPHFHPAGRIGIGWGVGQDPARLQPARLLSRISKLYGKRHAKHALRQVMRFRNNLSRDDRVIVMDGYAPNQKCPVRLWGYARKIGPFAHKPGSIWFENQRKAATFDVNRDVPVTVFRRHLQGSLMQALHGPYSEAEISPLLRDLSVRHDIHIV